MRRWLLSVEILRSDFERLNCMKIWRQEEEEEEEDFGERRENLSEHFEK